MKSYVSDKQSLKRAYDSKADEIIITGSLAKKFNKIKEFAKLPLDSLRSLEEHNNIVAETAAVATTLSISNSVAVSLIILASSIGVSLLIAILKDYQPSISIQHEKTEIRFHLKK